LLGELDQAVTARPFGDPRRIEAAAAKLAAPLNQLAQDAALTQFDKAATERALRYLTDANQLESNDFATARQAAWSIRELAKDLHFDDAPQAYFDVEAAAKSPAILEASGLFLREGSDPLSLTLPSGQTRSVIQNLGRWLSAAANYDAAWFREELKATRTKLGLH